MDSAGVGLSGGASQGGHLEAQHGMQLDAVGCDAALTVDDVKERHGR